MKSNHIYVSFLFTFLSFGCLSLLFCPSDQPSTLSDSLKFGEMSFGTERAGECYLNHVHTYSLTCLHEVSFATPLCVFDTDTWILQTPSVLFSGTLNTSELLSFIWDVSIIFCCKNVILLPL